MRSITILSIPILLVATLGAYSSKGTSSLSRQADSSNLTAQLRELETAPDWLSGWWYLRRAKIMGERQVVLSGLRFCGAEIQGLKKGLTKSDVIVAESIEKYVQVHEFGLMTWYKFRIVEDLSLDLPRERPYCGEPIPAQILPVAYDEIVVPRIGGEVSIDGVRLIQPHMWVDIATGLPTTLRLPPRETEPAAYKTFVNPQTFLIFLSITPDKRVGVLFHDVDDGVFPCDAGGDFRHSSEFTPLSRDLDKKGIHSLRAFREYRNRLRDRL